MSGRWIVADIPAESPDEPAGGDSPAVQHESVTQLLMRRQTLGAISTSHRIRLLSHFVPAKQTDALPFTSRVFCGSFSRDGRTYMAASQDAVVHLFDYPGMHVKRKIHARDIGWSVLDTDYSPDQQFLIYSSWSPFVHLCNVGLNHSETHEALRFCRRNFEFCLFSVKFSESSNEILGGSNEPSLIVYDLAQQAVVVDVRAHHDDINSVAFADESSQILLSGSDDSLCKVWDRRILANGTAVGVFRGHSSGLTHVSAKGDGRYLITNGKDHTIKLWDMRRMGSVMRTKGPQQDCSLMTYRGHRVRNTLIRAKFSPVHTTGQKYIYSGSADGIVRVWNVLTGEVERRLQGLEGEVIRDVSWHPYEPVLCAASWEHTVNIWESG